VRSECRMAEPLGQEPGWIMAALASVLVGAV
jgi:hypothetical protein